MHTATRFHDATLNISPTPFPSVVIMAGLIRYLRTSSLLTASARRVDNCRLNALEPSGDAYPLISIVEPGMFLTEFAIRSRFGCWLFWINDDPFEKNMYLTLSRFSVISLTTWGRRAQASISFWSLFARFDNCSASFLRVSISLRSRSACRVSPSISEGS